MPRQAPAINFGDHVGDALGLNSWSVDSLPLLSADYRHISVLRLAESPSGNLPFDLL